MGYLSDQPIINSCEKVRMKIILVLSLFCMSCASTSSDAGGQRLRAAIAGMESVLALPNGAASLHEYARYYAKGSDNRGHLLGVFVLSKSNGVHIVNFKGLPKVLDGGCGVIRLTYDMKAKRVVTIFCGGVA